MNHSSERIAYWDNLKAILIFLVVLGHVLLPMRYRGYKLVDITYTLIYLFHMPAFVFVSGYFSKSYVRKGSNDIKRLIAFLVLYVLFSISLWLINVFFSRNISMLFIFSVDTAPWYLMCLFLWYLLIPQASKLKPMPALFLSVVLGLLVGTDYRAGAFLSLSRCIVFFPFFLFGYYFEGELINRIEKWMKVLSITVFIIALLSVYFFVDFFSTHFQILEASTPYESIVTGMFERSLWYTTSCILIIALILIIPKRQTIFTYIGRRTLPIYIVHRIVCEVFRVSGFYGYFSNGLQILFLSLLISITLTISFSWKRLSDMINKIFALDCNRWLV